jgi:hypothetical protein
MSKELAKQSTQPPAQSKREGDERTRLSHCVSICCFMDDFDTRYVHFPPSWFAWSSHLGSTPVLKSEKSDPDTKRAGVTMLLYRLHRSPTVQSQG